MGANQVAVSGQLNSTSVRDKSRWPAYPAHKPSGLPWLGDIPAHWDIPRLKNKASVTFSSVDKHAIDGEIPVNLCNYVDVYKNDFITPGMEFMQATASRSEASRFALREGDVLITKDSESWNDIAVSAYVSTTLPNVLCGYHLALIRPDQKELDGKFLFRTFQAKAVNYQFQVAANGITRYGISKNSIDNALFPLPPLSEQHAIAAFLDRETARLDRLIAKKERLSELLGEKRAALISHAVTRGLDPSVPLKDSGVRWLGQVPGHWEVKRIRAIAESLQTGPFGSQLHSHEYVSGGIPVINPSHMKDGRIVPDWDSAVDDTTWQRLSQHELHEGDIVFARRGEMGRCALVTETEEGWLCGTGSLRMRPIGGVVDSYYLNRVLSTKGVGDWLLLESVGTTMDNLNTTILANVPVPAPPLSEQRAIAAYLDREMAKLDALMAKVREGIEKLREHRAALIGAAVTGQIDVRGLNH